MRSIRFNKKMRKNAPERPLCGGVPLIERRESPLEDLDVQIHEAGRAGDELAFARAD